MSNIENWRPVVGWEGRYEVSDLGRVRSDRGVKVPQLRPDGYVQVQLKNRPRIEMHLVHVLVDRAFNGPIPPGLEVNHADGVKTNCALSNLERMTHRKNIQHAVATGLWGDRAGERHGRAKLDDDKVRAIRAALPFTKGIRVPNGAAAKLAREYDVSQSVIGDVIRRKTWGHVQ